MKYNKEILNRFLTEKVAIHVETRQEWNDFMKLLESETECKWRSGKLPTDVGKWTHSKEDTAVVLNYFGNNGLGYSSCDFYQNDGYEVIKYKDLIKGEETMTNIEKVNKALENADEDKIKEVLDFLGYKEDEKFIPKNDERYYVVDSLGNTDFHMWRDDKYDHHALLMSNVYRTKEEAEQAVDFQTRKAKLIKEIEDSSDVIDWSDEDQGKYRIFLDGSYNSLAVSGNAHAQTQGTNYTTNKQFLEILIAKRSDEVKELLFGIKL